MVEDTKSKPKYGSNTTALEVLENVDLSGKTALVTGTTSGIGGETARALALKGCHVVMCNRNMELSEKLREKIYEETAHRKIDIIQLDLNSLESIQKAAKEFLSKNWPLHILILNAGVVWAPTQATKDGHEATFGINHLGHFYLTYLLFDKLRESATARIVVVSSKVHANTGINPKDDLAKKLHVLIPSPDTNKFGMTLYSFSKLCNVLFALKLHRSEHQNGIHTYVLHPGIMPETGIGKRFGILSRIFAYLATPFLKNLEQGAATSIYCAASPYSENESGRYYSDCHESEKDLDVALARDEALQDALWEKSVELIKKFEQEKSHI